MAEELLDEIAESRGLPRDQALIYKIKERYRLAEEAERDQRVYSEDDLRFCDPVNQWSEADKTKRQMEGKPCLSIDRTTPFVKQVTNEQRQNRPTIHVSATGENATEDVAEIKTGLIRHILEDSNGDHAIDTGFESMVRMGFGYMRVITEYENPYSFRQVLKLKRIPNAFMVHIDPSYTEADGSDMRWATIEEDVPLDEFKEEYGDKSSARFTSEAWASIGTEAPGWAAKDGSTVRVVEYYELKRVPIKLKMGTDGKGYELDQKFPAGVKQAKYRDGKQVVRDSFKKEVRWWKVNALEILDGGVEGRETVFEWVPIVPIFGDELIINNRRTYAGLIRHAKDVQRMINYWKSTQTYIIAMAPKAPWVGPVGFRGDRENEWNLAATSGAATLEYDWWDNVRNEKMPEPHRDVAEPPIRAITEALGQSEEDIKACLGMFDPSLGNNKGMADQSGVAIKSLQSQGAIVNFHFADNLARSLKFLGRLLNKAIRRVYDTARIERIIEPDGTTKTVQLNGEEPLNASIKKIYDVTTDEYDVVVTIGPSYNTKRQENLALLVTLLRDMPVVGQAAPDLVVSQMDAPIVKKLVKRLEKTLAPGLLDPKDGPPLPPQVSQQLQQATQLVQQQHMIIQQLQGAIESKKFELESRERIANLQARTSMVNMLIQARSNEAMKAYSEENDAIEHRLNLLHEAVQIEASSQQPSGEPGQGEPEQQASSTGGNAPGSQ